jgi:hypothetical protein
VNSATYANGTVTYYCALIAISPSYARKKELMVDLDVVYRPQIAP